MSARRGAHEVLARRTARTLRSKVRRAPAHVQHFRHRLRAAQSPHDVLQRVLPPGQETNAYLSELGAGVRCRWFLRWDEIDGAIAQLDDLVAPWRSRTIRAADRILDGELRLLAVGPYKVGRDASGRHEIPWHEDVVTGHRWNPRQFHKLLDVGAGRAEIRMPWEISRCHHLFPLGLAYRLTGESRYAAAAIEHLLYWIDSNPVGYGVNWYSPMEAAIRAVNWLWAYHFIGTAADVLTPGMVAALAASLLEHGEFISHNIERYEGGITTNHTLADYLGLLCLGLFLDGAAPAADWVAVGRAGLEECMETQVFADGVDFENSIPYHRLTLEMLVAAYVLSSKTGDPLSPSFRERLFGMFDYVGAYTRPDGRAPLVGDSDDGRLHVLADYFGWIPDDHRYLLAVGSAIFDQPQWRRVAAQSPTALEELAWLCGPAAVAAYATGQRAASEPTPRAFAPSGHYVLAAPEYHAVVSADPVGTGGLGNHKHNDIFSYELSVHGVPVIVDRGSFRYLSDERARAYFRSTRSHSTVMVQGAEQNALTGTFGMRPDADVNVAQWVTAERETLFDARHTGYMRLERPVVHRRIIYASTGPFGWVVLDVLEGSGEHTIESHIHFHPDGKLTLKEFPVQPSADALLASAQEHAPGLLHSAPRLTPVAQYRQCNVTVRVLSFNTRVAEAREAQHSPRFGQAVSAPVLHLHAEVSAGTAFGYVIQGSVAE